MIASGGVGNRCGNGRARVWVNHNRCRWIQQPLGRKLRHVRHLSQPLNRWRSSLDGGVLQTYKPGSVSLPEGRAVTIYLAQPLAVKPAEVRFWRSDVTAAVKQPTRGRAGRLSPPIWPCSRWGLAAAASPQTAGRSYRPISPLSRRTGTVCFCATIRPLRRQQCRLRSLGVTQHPAQWSPDFPPPRFFQRSTGRRPPSIPALSNSTVAHQFSEGQANATSGRAGVPSESDPGGSRTWVIGDRVVYGK